MYRALATLILFAALPACTLAQKRGLAADPAGNAAVRRGEVFAVQTCSGCHAISATGASPNPAAPPLRTLRTRYNVESLEEAFAEGIVVAHPDMPRFELAPEQISDLMAYLRSLS